MNGDDFVLYILMRKDMASLNHAGKMIAQGAHAANHAAEAIGTGEFGMDVMVQFAKWQKQTPQGFGTTVVLGGIQRRFAEGITITDIHKVVDGCLKLGIAAAVIIDPGYPLQDGDVMHAFPCETCAWVFGSKAALTPVLWPFKLHPETERWLDG